MGTPEYDQNRYTIPYDDADIKDQHSLFRYIDIIRNCDDGKISSGAFGTSSKKRAGPNPGMSTDWKESIESSGQDLFYRVKPEEIVAELNVQFLRQISKNVMVGQTPDNDHNNPHHTDVWGVKNHGRKMRGHATYHLKSRIPLS
ncbi:MAG: hypothetical protein GY797_36545 [Deltaproteobacteria bacterium]|nr:hypothetical protein [Deltaproteobacteria bacterium]